MRKSLLELFMLSIVFVSLICVEVVGFSKTTTEANPIITTSLPSNRPLVFVDPQLTEKDVGQEFTISVKIFNLTDTEVPDPVNPRTKVPLGNLYGVQFRLLWNASILEYVTHEVTIPVDGTNPGSGKGPYPDGVLHKEVWEYANDVTTGQYDINYISLFPAAPFNNPGKNSTVFTMKFRVKSKGACDLTLTSSEISDNQGRHILHFKWDGSFQTPGVPIASFTYWPSDGYAVKDKPTMFNASASTSTPPGNIESYIWDFNTTDTTGAFRVSTDQPNINFTYTRKGTTTVKLTVKDKNSVLSKPLMKTLNVVESRDVAVTDIKLWPEPVLGWGFNLTIDKTIYNMGGAQENFTISTYYNSSPTGDWKLIEQEPVLNWPKGTIDHLIFKWNTSALPKMDATYYIFVSLTTVPHEANITNNSMRSFKPIYITTEIFHDISVAELNARIVVSSTEFYEAPFLPKENVTIVFKVVANGTTSETYNVTLTVKAQNGSTLLTNVWKNQFLEPYAQREHSFYTTKLEAGNCTISINATISEEDKSLGNNLKAVKVPVVVSPILKLASLPSTIREGDTVTFDATSSSHPGGKILTYEWKVIRPGSTTYSDTKNGSRVDYLFDQAGNWSVQLVVTDNWGLTYEPRRLATGPYRLETIVKVEGGTQGLSFETYVIVAVVAVAVVGAIAFWRFRKPPSPPPS